VSKEVAPLIRLIKTSKSGSSVHYWGLAILLLLVCFAQLAFGSRQLSLTSDEPPHLGAGYTYLTTGETWHIPSLGNPPLLLAWVAWPVVLGNPHLPLQTLPNWHTRALPPYFRALFPLLGPVEQLEVAGRVPVMLLGVLLGGLVFRWAADLFGYKGGLLALALMVFDPTMVAHAQLATTDVGVTLLGFAMFFVGWRWARTRWARTRWARTSRAPTEDIRWSIGIGLLAGATMAAKVSGLVWVGLVVGIMAAVEVARSTGRKPGFFRKTWFLAVLRRSATVVVVAFLFLWGVYGFRVGPLRVGPYLLAVPASHHWEGMLQQIASPSLRLMFLAGETRVGGWWWYFPFAFLIKNPVPLLVIWIGAVIVSVRRRSLTIPDFLFLLAFPAVYVAVAIHSKVNIGYRHLLPIHPFLYVLAAQWVDVGRKPGLFRETWFLAASASQRSGGGFYRKNRVSFVARVLWVALWMWYVVGTIRIFPHYLAYFNELVGGPSNGYRYLVDSNLDWGQDFKVLKETLAHLDVRPPLRLGHYWYAGPELYGIQYEPLPPLPGASSVFSPRFDPSPGTYVLGATLLQCGRGDLEQYEWFKHHTPVAQPGHALFVYRVDPHRPPATWVAQCTQPAPPLDDELISREFHTQPLRRVYFDCTQSWIYPEDGQTSGWYVLHDEVLQIGSPPLRGGWGGVQEDEPFLPAHLDQTHLAYVHHQNDAMAPAFHLYEFRPAMRALGYTSAVRVAPAGMRPREVIAERSVVTAPLSLEGPLVFLGYRVLGVSLEAVTMETWWKVAGTEVAAGLEGLRPLSIMAHVVDGEGHPIAVADGLGVPIEVWQVGDVVVQYHDLSLASGVGGQVYWLQAGVYWLDTLERQEVTGPGSDSGDRILLGEIRLADEPILRTY